MDNDRLARKLAAILYADVAGYSRLTGEDEEGTHRRLSNYLDRFAEVIAEHHGRVVHYAGDAILADFETVSDAIGCAVTVQCFLGTENDALSEEQRVEFRIGINLGEVIVDRDDIYGDGVNVAARLEGLAEPGGICVSETVRTAAGRKLGVSYEFLGERAVKNIAEPVRAYRLRPAEALQSKVLTPPPCPYPGMVPFQPEDASSFHGRESEIAQMVSLLRHQRFMMVIGPSGSGKSSLVQAGLLPALERSRYFTTGYWLILRMRPGPEPNAALSRVFGLDPTAEDFEPDAIDQLLGSHPPAERALLLVDQFEEAFTQATREQASRFIGDLGGLRTRQNLALVLTLRADFYPDLMSSRLWPVDASQRVEVAPLKGEALREAIVMPAERVGVRVEEGLLERLLADAADEPGVLPLLQETMRLLWDEMEARALPLAAYDRLSRDSAAHTSGASTSGLSAAIAMKADATFAGLGHAEQAIARRTFLRLVQFGEGRADTRRQQPLAALRAADDEGALFERTLEHLTDDRLLTRAGGDERESVVVDLAHESLITGWARLRAWAEERREAEQVRRRLDAKTAEWVRLGRGSGGLLDLAELPEAERWLASPDARDLGHDPALQELVAESNRKLDEAAREHELSRQRELSQAKALAAEQRQRSDEQARATERFRRLSVALTGIFIIALVAAIFAWRQGQIAQAHAAQEAQARLDAQELAAREHHARQEAEARRLGSIAQLLFTLALQQAEIHQDERSALLARQAYLLVLRSGTERSLSGEADRVLRTLLSSEDFAVNLAPNTTTPALAISRDGSMLVSAHGNIGKLLLWNLEQRGSAPMTIAGHPELYLLSLAFRPDGEELAAGGDVGKVFLWNLTRPAAAPRSLDAHAAGIWSVAYSPDGHHLAAAGKGDDVVLVWNLTDTGSSPMRLGSDDRAPSPAPLGAPGGVPVAYSPDGRTLAAGSFEGGVRLWRTDEPHMPPLILSGHEEAVWSVAFSPDGRFLASGSKDSSVRVWDLNARGATPVVLRGHEAPVVTVAFSPDGDVLASGSKDATVRIWSMDQPDAPPVILDGHQQGVFGLAFRGAGRQLVSASYGSNSLRLWDLAPSAGPRVLGQVPANHGDSHVPMSFSPDGQLLAAGGGESGGIWLWDMAAPHSPPTFTQAHDSEVWSVELSPDGRALVSGDEAGQAKLWRVEDTLRAVHAWQGQPGGIWDASFDPTGKTVAIGGGEGAVHLQRVDGRTAEPIVLPTDVSDWITEVAYNPNGDLLAVAGRGGVIHLKHPGEPTEPGTVLRGHERMVWSVEFSPDGRRLASGGRDNTVRLWDLHDMKTRSLVIGRHTDDAIRVRFSPDGRRLASASKDRSIRLWDLDDPTATPAMLHGHKGGVWTIEFDPNGRLLASAARDGEVLLWDLTHSMMQLKTAGLAELVCEKVWRNLTLDEWQQFVGEDIPYERTCPDLPEHSSVARGK